MYDAFSNLQYNAFTGSNLQYDSDSDAFSYLQYDAFSHKTQVPGVQSTVAEVSPLEFLDL